MESKNKISPAGLSRRKFLTIGATVLASPLTGMAEKILPRELKGNIKYEQFISEQINKIKEIINHKKYDDILSSPYLVYCLYYSQSFLDQVSDPKNRHYVSEKIIGSVAHLITPEFRAQAILSLEEQTKDEECLENRKISTSETLPLKKFIFGQGENHNNAIDLFTDELSPVYSTDSGLVLVADNGWRPNDDLSSSSIKGGNTVIIFNYLKKEFYRYAHLNNVAVHCRELVIEGEKLGVVGHTGNASRKGHGHHLHFEIHKYLDDKNTNQALWASDLRKRLENLKHIT